MENWRILCYGNSNTFGYDALDGSRFSEENRWPTVMAERLGCKITVIEEGYNGRTIRDIGPFGGLMNGTSYFPVCVEQHNPLHLVILHLGINDLFLSGGLNVRVIAEGMGYLVELGRGVAVKPRREPTEFLVIAPPPVNPGMPDASFHRGEIEASLLLTVEYEKVCRRLDCYFFDAGRVIEAMALDGVHLDAESHRTLGACVAAFLEEHVLSSSQGPTT
jgi:lysophospholipase L1-like esterase